MEVATLEIGIVSVSVNLILAEPEMGSVVVNDSLESAVRGWGVGAAILAVPDI